MHIFFIIFLVLGGYALGVPTEDWRSVSDQVVTVLAAFGTALLIKYAPL